MKPFVSQRSNNQSVMFGRHVDSIIMDNSPKGSQTLLPEIEKADINGMDYT